MNPLHVLWSYPNMTHYSIFFKGKRKIVEHFKQKHHFLPLLLTISNLLPQNEMPLSCTVKKSDCLAVLSDLPVLLLCVILHLVE